MTALEDARTALRMHGTGSAKSFAMATAMAALIAEHERLTAPPTDAQVKAALEAFEPLYPPVGNDWTAARYADMRAALVAARADSNNE